MNDEYLKGLQDASIDVLEHGCMFAEKIIKEFGEMEDTDYSDGYLKGYDLMLERGKLLQKVEVNKMKNLSYLKGKELAKQVFEKYGYDQVLNLYINYMENHAVSNYSKDVKEEIKGYCDGFAEIMLEIQNGYFEEIS